MKWFVALLVLFAQNTMAQSGNKFRFEFQFQPKSKIIVNEYKTTWLGGTTNKRHAGVTDDQGHGVIEFVEDNYHYFNSHVCVVAPDKLTYCQDIALFPKSEPTCFLNLAKNQICQAGQAQHVCQFKLFDADQSVRRIVVGCLPKGTPMLKSDEEMSPPLRLNTLSNQ